MTTVDFSVQWLKADDVMFNYVKTEGLGQQANCLLRELIGFESSRVTTTSFIMPMMSYPVANIPGKCKHIRGLQHLLRFISFKQ